MRLRCEPLDPGGLHRLVFNLVECRRRLDPEGRRGKLTFAPTGRQPIRPPLEIVQTYPQAEFGYGVPRALLFVERLEHLREDLYGSQRYHFGLDRDLG